MQSYVFQQLK